MNLICLQSLVMCCDMSIRDGSVICMGGKERQVTRIAQKRNQNKETQRLQNIANNQGGRSGVGFKQGPLRKAEAVHTVRNAQEEDSLDRKVQRHRSVHADLHWSPVNHFPWDPAPPRPCIQAGSVICFDSQVLNHERTPYVTLRTFFSV